jgi:hypothetical protein
MSSSPLQTYFADLLQEKKATELVLVDDHHSPPTRITKHTSFRLFPSTSPKNKPNNRNEVSLLEGFENRGDKRLARRAWPLYTQDDVIPIIKKKSLTAKTG